MKHIVCGVVAVLALAGAGALVLCSGWFGDGTGSARLAVPTDARPDAPKLAEGKPEGNDSTPANNAASAGRSAPEPMARPEVETDFKPAKFTQRQLNRNFWALVREQILASLPASDKPVDPSLRENIMLLSCRAGELYPVDHADYRKVGSLMAALGAKHGNPPALAVAAAFLQGYYHGDDPEDDEMEATQKMLPSPERISALPPFLRGLYWLTRSWGQKDGKGSYGKFLEAAFAAVTDRLPVAQEAQAVSLAGGGTFPVMPYDPALQVAVVEELLAKSVADEVVSLDEAMLEALRTGHPGWEWFAEYAGGARELALAWQARGSGWAKSVTDEGRKGFREHCAKSEALFMHSWELRRDLPYAAGHMIAAMQGRHASQAEYLRWSQRGMLARPDELRGIIRYKWFALEPRWNGSAEALRDFALRNLRNGRYDTYLPLYAFRMLEDVFIKQNQQSDWRQIWRQPEVQREMDRLFPALLAEPGNAFLRERLQVQYALVKMWMGRYEEAQKELKAIAAAQELVKQELSDERPLSYFGQSWDMIQNELQANTGPYAARIREGEELVFAGKKEAGVEVWAKIIGECAGKDDRLAAYLRWRGGFVLLDQDWDTSKWTFSLLLSPGTHAIRMGNLDVLRWLLNNKENPVARNAYDLSLFYESANFGKVEALKCILPLLSKEQINERYSGWSALAAATFRNHLNTLTALLDAGADINQMTEDGYPPVYYAAQEGHRRVLERLLERGADPKLLGPKAKRDILSAAAREGRVEVVTFLLQRGWEINQTSPDGSTPLYNAAVQNETEMVQFLLEKGADPEKGLYDKAWTCLMAAAYEGNAKTVRMLLEKGADPTRKVKGRDAVTVAKKGSEEVLLLLKTALTQRRAAAGGTPSPAAGSPGAKERLTSEEKE